MARAFLAIRPPPSVVEAVLPVADEVERGLGEGARLAPPSQWHVTLRFYESVDLATLDEALTQFSPPRLRLTLEGFGAFPNERRARVVWIGVGGDVLGLRAVAAEIERLTAGLTWVEAASERAADFHPHLTLARMRAPRDVRRHLGRWRAEHRDPLGDWLATDVILFRSDLARGRATHHVVRRYRGRDASE